MGLPLQQINYSTFGGGNWSDQPNELIRRSHRLSQGVFQQVNPVESPNMENIDFPERGLGKRKGSTASIDWSSVLISGDTIINEIAWTPPGSETEEVVAAGAKGIYYDQGTGVPIRITNANATNFQFDTDATKVSFVEVDNHLMIMTDTNYSQVYRTGGALDNQANNSTTATTVDASSASGQKVLNVAATTMFAVGDRIVIDSAGTPEYGYTASIQAGVSITLEDNLGATYTTETVAVANLYTESKGGGTQTYTGDWNSGHYWGFELHERWVMGKGDNVAEYSDSREAWDLAGGGYRLARGNIIGGIAFVPEGGSELNSIGFMSTDAGPTLLQGFDLSDTTKPIHGKSTALNYRCILSIENWIVYLTKEGGIEGVNVGQTIDLGRRYKTLDGVTGPLDTFTATNTAHRTKPFGFYDQEKKQAQWYFPDSSNTANSHAVVLDMYLGEPVVGEAKESFESRVRCLYWSIKEPATNPWFVSVFQKKGSVVGMLATGKSYTLENGLNDLGTLPILDIYQLPHFDGGAPDNIKNWRKAAASFISKGNWNVRRRHYLDRDDAPIGSESTWLMVGDGVAVYDMAVYDTATYVSGGMTRKSDWIEEYSLEISHDLRNQQTSENWIMANFTQEYQIGAKVN